MLRIFCTFQVRPVRSEGMCPWYPPTSRCYQHDHWSWCRECPVGSSLCLPPTLHRFPTGGSQSFWYHDGAERDHISRLRKPVAERGTQNGSCAKKKKPQPPQLRIGLTGHPFVSIFLIFHFFHFFHFSLFPFFLFSCFFISFMFFVFFFFEKNMFFHFPLPGPPPRSPRAPPKHRFSH